MSNVLSDEKRQQILALGRLGWPLRRIEQATGVRRETVGAYLKAAGIAVRRPGGWGRRGGTKPAPEVTADPDLAKPANKEVTTDSEPPKPESGESRSGRDPAKPANEVTTDSEGAKPALETSDTGASTPLAAVKRQSSRSVSACEPYRELIEEGLSRERNAMAIWQDLVSQHGFASSYQSVKRFVNKLHPAEQLQARAVIITAPGEEGQVDYGTGPMVREQPGGKYRRTRLFVFTLGFSRKAVRLLIFRSSTRIWAELHERAFRRLGGSVRIVVL